MGRRARRAAFEARWRTEWTANGTTLRTPTAFENAPLLLTRVDQTQSLSAPPTDRAWVRLSIREGDTRQADLNSAPRMREQGRVYAQIFTLRGKGTDEARDLTDLAVPIFQRKQFAGITCRAGEVQIVGEVEGWFQVNVSWPYFADDIDS